MRRIWVLLMCLGMLAGCHRAEVNVPKQPPQDFIVAEKSQADQAAQLAAFVDQKFVQPGGVITSLNGASVAADAASGQDYLSESMGLWLLHLVATEQYQEFRTFFAAGKKKLYNGHNFSYRLQRPQDKASKVNASADDLRIIRALLAYDEATGTTHYRRQAATLYANWAQGCLPDGQLRDFYDVRYRKASSQASLAYFDLQTLNYFMGDTKYYRQLEAVVQHGYLGDAFPLYATSYNWDDVAYADKDLNTSEALEVLLQLARVGLLKPSSEAWLVQRLEDERLPNTMTTSGGIVDRNQSVANWALIAQIFAAQHDAKHYQQAMVLIWSQQVPHGKLAGGFGDSKSGAAFSYNNLNVLLAADMEGQAHAED